MITAFTESYFMKSLRNFFFVFTVLALKVSILGCSSDSGSAVEPDISMNEAVAILDSNIAIPDNRFSDTYNILIFGNSHVSGIGVLIEQMLEAEHRTIEANIDTFGGGFLDNPANYNSRLERLQSQNWSHVILQGQKYSQSGATVYPTTETQYWIGLVKKQNATPILFPEHPQRGNREEGQRVHDLHVSISEKQASCIAPVGLVWDRVIALQPNMNLYMSDGNHAAKLGNVLTAMVFYEVITGYSADLLPYIEELDIREETQRFFGQVVSEIIEENVPCSFEGSN